ncbi:hypothetical protein F750_4486 [Streptomyces sp. PAMC 26508]|nr:hypothetical protein F750_4486 [Streptomyces sp. PAMC 26508]
MSCGEECAGHRPAHRAESDDGDAAVPAGGGVLLSVHPSMLGARHYSRKYPLITAVLTSE